MDSEGKIPISSLGYSKVFTTHTPHVDDEEGYEFPPEGFPFTGRVPSLTLPETSGPMLSPGYTTLARLVSGTPSASPWHQNPIWSSNSMPNFGWFISNKTYQISAQTPFTLVLVQPVIPSQLVPSFQPSILVQPTISGQVSVRSSTALPSEQNVPPPRGKIRTILFC